MDYIVFNHDVKAEELEWEHDLHKLRTRCKTIVFIDAELVHAHVAEQEVRIVNGSHENPKCHLGWTVQVSTLVEINAAKPRKQLELFCR